MNSRLNHSLATLLIALSPHFATAQQPAQIRPETVEAVKQATVLLRVTGSDGKVMQGSGFLAVAPGVVVTNAHVVGMRLPKTDPPSKIEIIIHSGESNEIRVTGQVLGVDRKADLAVLKVEAEGKLPTSLQLGVKDKLYELQKLYIFGFPFEKELGKNITVSETSISSLRKDASGAVEKIQVNGGMNPGNSGGPVVNAKGDVVAVSVSGIRGTLINLGIPSASVQSFLEGGIQEAKPGDVFRKNDQSRVSVQYDCLDPLQLIREVRVEIWAGKPDANRSFSATQAKHQEGDGPRQSVALKYSKSVASAEVPLPKLAPGQVAWVQPVLVLAKEERWGQPHAFDCSLPMIVQKFKGHSGPVRCVFLSDDCKQVLTGSHDKTAMLWDANGKRLLTFRGHANEVYGVALSADGKHVVTASTDKTVILWDAGSAKILRTFQGHNGAVWSLALSGDASKLLSGAADGTAILWDVASGKRLQSFQGPHQIRAVALSSNGKQVLTGSFDRTAILWEAASGKQLQTFRGHAGEVSCVALSADGRHVVTCSENDGKAILWDAASGKSLQTLQGHNGGVLSLALSGDGKHILTGGTDKTAILWDAASGRKLQTFRGHTETVHAVALSRDGKHIVTGSNDGTAILWEVDVSPASGINTRP